MILGHGDIASVLVDRDDLLFFASGVSNSREERESEYKREKDLLLSQKQSSHIVYISSLSVFYSDTRYAKHKRSMESLVKIFDTWTIIRLGNITWGTNPHTLINFFREEHARGRQLDIQDTYRYLVDKEEFLYWIGLIPKWSCEMNIPGKRMKISEIAEQYVYNKKTI